MKYELENEIWEAYLKEAVIEHTLKEIESYPASEIAKTELPADFTTKIRKFVRRYRRRIRITKTIYSLKKIACIVLILIGISFASLLQFHNVRAACRNAIMTIYERYVEIFFTPSDVSENTIPKLGFIPDGFYLKETKSTNSTIVLIYANNSNEEISLSCFHGKHTLQIDNEHTEMQAVQINNLQGTFFKSSDSKFKNFLVWNTAEKSYMLSSYQSKDVLLKIAENIQ